MSDGVRPYRAWTSFYGLGFWAASIVSYDLNHSVFWLFAHGFCSWLYLIYAGLFL